MIQLMICDHCKNIVEVVSDAGVAMQCCGQNLTPLVANTTDAAKEKHVPVVQVEGNVVTVTVGSVAHPMLAEHHISFVYLVTTKGVCRKMLAVGGEPVAQFVLAEGEAAVEALEYCNLHGLWSVKL